MDMSLKKFKKVVKDRDVWHAAVHGVERALHDLATEQQQAIEHYWLYMCMCIYMCMCMCIYTCVCVCVYIHVYVYVYIYMRNFNTETKTHWNGTAKS